MSLPDNESPEKRGIDWPAVARTLLFQVIVLLALAGASVGYISWSSDAAFEEFIAASEPAKPDQQFALQSATPVLTSKRPTPCPRKD